jgi:hypothetical protein
MFKLKDLPFRHRRREIRRSNRCKILAISIYHFTNTENKFHKYEPLSLFLYSQEAPTSSHLEIILFTRNDFLFFAGMRERGGARENP